MPTYVYKCPECEVEVEERRKMSQADDPLDCPLCGGQLVRGITTFMFNRGRAAPAPETSLSTAAPHGRSCPCCYPIPRRNK
ncbi:MAG: zinc ribbon domain-containing protein [Ardenticatenaceae bacterium]|nr:zinc ribbon domain-containing protein [Ardenticatenaceae bacterium]